MENIRFCVFADLHFGPGAFMSNAPERLQEIQKRAKEKKVDFMIHLGDFCHLPKQYIDWIKSYKAFEIPAFHVLGNHDLDHCSKKELLQIYDMEKPYYWFERGGFRFIVLDGNHLCQDNQWKDYDYGNYHHKEYDFKEGLDPEQMKWLERAVLDSEKPMIIFSHQSLFVASRCVRQHTQIEQLFDKAKERDKKILLAMNGHLHLDHLQIKKQTAYWNVNSATHDWLPKTHEFYPKHLTEKFNRLSHTVVYDQPLHAIVDVSTDGTIQIEGMKGGYFMDVSHKKVDYTVKHGQFTSSCISSYSLILK